LKIVITPLNDIYKGIINAAQEVFKDTVLWNPDVKPVYDMLDEEKPDLLICDIRYATDSFIKAMNEYKVNIVLFGNGAPQGLNPKVLCASPNTGVKIREFIEQGDHETLYLDKSANTALYNDGEKSDLFESDISYISTNTKNMFEKILILSELNKDNVLKIYGNTRMPLDNYLGNVRNADISRILNSSNAVLDWNGEFLLDIIAHGSFCLPNIPNPYFDHFDTVNELPAVLKYVKQKKKGNGLIKKNQQEVLNNHTCFHRLCDIVKAAKLDNTYQKICEEKIEEVKCKLV
jgi:hypothetical protein